MTRESAPNYEDNREIKNVVIPKPVQTKSRQTGRAAVIADASAV